MAKMDRPGYMSGDDAAYIKPKFVPDASLRPRDNSGGAGFDPYTQQFGDGGEVTGYKEYLSADSGKGREKGNPRRGNDDGDDPDDDGVDMSNKKHKKDMD